MIGKPYSMSLLASSVYVLAAALSSERNLGGKIDDHHDQIDFHASDTILQRKVIKGCRECGRKIGVADMVQSSLVSSQVGTTCWRCGRRI